ncbi:MAG: hypothetical protein H0U20_01765 [Thermoleophilaceae bacterium]|nr:hypothetical protein [Thermoleophilaceae bacterium]
MFVRRRRWGRWIALAVVLLVAAAAAGLAWVLPMVTYDGVEEGAFSSAGPDGRPVKAGPFGEYVSIRYRAGVATSVDVSVANNGDRDVRVTSLGDRRGLSGVRPRGVRIGEANSNGPPRRYVPFREFDLPAGQARGVRLLYRTGACSALPKDSSVTFEALHLRWRTGFVEREQTIELRSPIEFRRDGICERRSG